MRHFHHHGYPIEILKGYNTHIRIRIFFDGYPDMDSTRACFRTHQEWKKACSDGDFGRQYPLYSSVVNLIPERKAMQVNFDFLDVEDRVIEDLFYRLEDALYGARNTCRIVKIVLSYGDLPVDR